MKKEKIIFYLSLLILFILCVCMVVIRVTGTNTEHLSPMTTIYSSPLVPASSSVCSISCTQNSKSCTLIESDKCDECNDCTVIYSNDSNDSNKINGIAQKYLGEYVFIYPEPFAVGDFKCGNEAGEDAGAGAGAGSWAAGIGSAIGAAIGAAIGSKIPKCSYDCQSAIPMLSVVNNTFRLDVSMSNLTPVSPTDSPCKKRGPLAVSTAALSANNRDCSNCYNNKSTSKTCPTSANLCWKAYEYQEDCIGIDYTKENKIKSNGFCVTTGTSPHGNVSVGAVYVPYGYKLTMYNIGGVTTSNDACGDDTVEKYTIETTGSSIGAYYNKAGEDQFLLTQLEVDDYNKSLVYVKEDSTDCKECGKSPNKIVKVNSYSFGDYWLKIDQVTCKIDGKENTQIVMETNPGILLIIDSSKMSVPGGWKLERTSFREI